MLDILFIHSNASKKIYQDLSKNHSAIEPPIWAGLLNTACKKKNYVTLILDCEANQYNEEQSVKIISELKPKIACFVVYGQQPSASSQNMEGAVSISRILKKEYSNIKILFVGGHVAALPVPTMKNEDSIDFLCTNEGVYTILNLLKIQDLSKDEYLKKVKGLCFRDKDKNIILNEPEMIVPKSLLEVDLPGIDWALMPDIKKYRTAGWHSWTNDGIKTPFASLYTSLGCPYKCSFCMINIINRVNHSENITSENSNIFRWWSPDFIINQFDFFAKNSIKNIKIADELFVLNPNHFIKICDLIIERGYDFNIWAYSRVDTCKKEYLEKLYKAGVKWLALGIESPRDLIRKEVQKDSFKEVKIMETIRTIEKSGINVAANYIFGLSNETNESMKFTLDFAMEANTAMVNFYTAMAYPGSPLYLEAKAKNIPLPQNYSGFSQHSKDTLNLPSDNLSSGEILKFRDMAWTKYHTNPKYLEMIKIKFGKNAHKNLLETTGIKLQRNNYSF